MRFRCYALSLDQEREDAAPLRSVGPGSDCECYSVPGLASQICLCMGEDNSLSLKIFFGADASSCGLNPGTALWLSGVFPGNKNRETEMEGK